MLCQKSVLKYFANFTGKRLYRSLFLIKTTTWIPATLLERDSSKGVYVFCKFYENFRRAFFQKTLWRPLLTWRYFFSFLQINENCSKKKDYFVEQCYITKKISGAGSILYSYGNQQGTSLTRRWSVMCTFIIRFFKCKILLKAGKKNSRNGKWHQNNLD